MPKKKGIRVVILAEDETLHRFASKVLMKFGFSRHELSPPSFPVGENAKQWVTKQYPDQVRAYRRKAAEQVALLVGTDADEQTVAQRRNALDDALRQASWPSRKDDERIVLWIPKWHIETWILTLLGRNVNENDNYKHEAKGADVPAAAIGFVDRFRAFKQDATIQVLPSLTIAFEETRRLNDV